MTGDLSPSSAALHQDTDPSHDNPAAANTSHSGNGSGNGIDELAPPPRNGDATEQLIATRSRRSRSDADRRRRKKKKAARTRNPGLKKKLAFLNHLLRELDLLVFAELSSLYYMECSMFQFFMRAMSQSLYLTPPDANFPIPMPSNQVPVLFILIPNIICILIHIFSSTPRGPDYNRGYQHGGLITDFIGQYPPSSRIYYLFVDVTVLAVQCLMFSLHMERKKLRTALRKPGPFPAELYPPVSAVPTLEELDAEERGENRDDLGEALDETENVEMRELGDTVEANDRAEEPDQTSADNLDEGGTRTYLSDTMDCGNGILGEYHIIHSMRTAATNFESTAAYSLQSLSYSATLVALEAQRRSQRAARTQGAQAT